jgi:hypothetical protein
MEPLKKKISLLNKQIMETQYNIDKHNNIQKKLKKKLELTKKKLHKICNHDWVEHPPLYNVPFERHYYICSLCNSSYHPASG